MLKNQILIFHDPHLVCLDSCQLAERCYVRNEMNFIFWKTLILKIYLLLVLPHNTNPFIINNRNRKKLRRSTK